MKNIFIALVAYWCITLLNITAVLAQSTNLTVAQMAAIRQTGLYYRQHILPIIEQQRIKLDNQLSLTDKAKLFAYHQQMTQLVQPTRSSAVPMPALSSVERSRLYQKSNKLTSEVTPLVHKYKNEIAKSLANLQLNVPAWKATLNSLNADSSSYAGIPAARLLEQLLTPEGFLLLTVPSSHNASK